MIQSRSLVIVLAVSFFMHALLLVSGARNEVARAQQPIGALLAGQLAGNAAPLLINKDSVGLGLLADRFGQTPGILSLKVTALDARMSAGGGNAPTLSGPVFKAPIVLEGKALGEAEVTLAGPASGDILRANVIPLLASLLMHLLFGSWLIWPQRFRAIRIPILQPLPPRRRREDQVGTADLVVEAAPPAATVFLQLALEDSKGLLQRVNASTADQMLEILEKLLLRSARHYHGKVLHAFGPEGATVRFEGNDAAACLQQALSCGRLFLSLADAAYRQRRTAKLFALPVKAAIGERGERGEGEVLDEILQLARRGSAQDLLLTVSETLAEPLKTGKHLISLDPLPIKETVKTETESANPDEPGTESGEATPDIAMPEAGLSGIPMVSEDTADASPATEEEPCVHAAPWRVLTLPDEDEARIQAQKQQILERRKAAVADTTAV